MNTLKAFAESPVGIASIVLTFLAAWITARSTRAGSREANRTADWDKFSASQAKRLDDEEDKTERLEAALNELRERVGQLEVSRYRWKWWAQTVVSSMRERGIPLPPTPESLENTDPRLRASINDSPNP